MSGFARSHSRAIGPALFLLLAAGCSGPAGAHNDTSATPASATAATPEPLPFRDLSIPAGTLLTVRLQNTVSADHPGDSGSFEAVMDEPVVVDGNTIVPKGSSVAGRVESASVSQMRGNRGYLRLVLDSIDIAGHEMPVLTSSLFTRARTQSNSYAATDAPSNPITLEKGRRLTFRLAQPLYLASPRLISTP